MAPALDKAIEATNVVDTILPASLDLTKNVTLAVSPRIDSTVYPVVVAKIVQPEVVQFQLYLPEAGSVGNVATLEGAVALLVNAAPPEDTLKPPSAASKAAPVGNTLESYSPANTTDGLVSAT